MSLKHLYMKIYPDMDADHIGQTIVDTVKALEVSYEDEPVVEYVSFPETTPEEIEYLQQLLWDACGCKQLNKPTLVKYEGESLEEED